MKFFDEPILNSPYELPARHWDLDENGRPTDQVIMRRRPSALWSALAGASAGATATQTSMAFDEDLSTAGTPFNPSAVVNELRQELDVWRALPNPAQWKVTPTTERLLKHWRALMADPTQTIRPFFCQLEAVEAAIWLAEVAPQMGRRGQRFLRALNVANNLALQPDGAPPDITRSELLRVAFKLATGAGKTTVMAMLIAWQVLNAARSPQARRFGKAFLIVTPGITIKDRLQVLRPNAEGNYYARLNLVPRDLLSDLHSARIVITNYHAFKRRETFEAASGTRRALEGHGAALQTLETEGQMTRRVMGDLLALGPVTVINDEAHHCYRERPVAEAEALTGEERREA